MTTSRQIGFSGLAGWLLAGATLGLSTQASAIDRDAVWVNPINQPSHLSWYQSSRADAISQSLIQPWLQQEASGDALNQWSSQQSSALLYVPMGVDRFVQGTLVVEAAEHSRVFVNGRQINGRNIDGHSHYELALQTGDHQVLVLVGGVEDWSQVQLDWQGKADHDVVDTTRPQAHRLYAEQLFDAQTTTNVSLSPDGEYVVWQRQHFSEATGDSPQMQTQLYHLASREVVFEWADNASQFSWSPNSQQLAFMRNDQLHTMQVGSGDVTRQTAALERLSSLRWLNDETLVFTLTEREDEHDGQVKRYRALEDRWNYFRQQADVFTYSLNDGVLSQVTELAGRISLQDTHADGDYVLVSQSLVDYAEPPHSLTRLLQIEIASGEVETIGEYRTFNQARYAPEGLYVVAGPEFGDGAGLALNDSELMANNYDGQLYQVSMNGADVTALSRDFDPAISQIMPTANGDLVVQTTDRDRSVLYHFNAQQGRFHRLDQVVDVIDSASVSQQGTPRVVYAGTLMSAPQRTYFADIGDSAQLLWDSADDAYRLNRDANTREWNFTNERGDTIYGRIYLPHNFDESRQYPALVYYYGGTTPVTRNFTGRYPFNLWADMGYVVYVLQPTGAIGFGQDFSARHVNAWGEYTTDDIIQGTRRFIEQHDFVDADRVGNLGASYGGFMTMLLATQTDLFAASMSHAGISHISSYWGHGWWGFGYSGEASKGSFPWNAPELYRERSPLNFADRINTPLLLIHGDSDTNVPPGESHMMYTALKMLDKDVELVEFIGEDHAINRRTPRLLWWQTYMAFFDKHLKDEPQWWDYLYSDR